MFLRGVFSFLIVISLSVTVHASSLKTLMPSLEHSDAYRQYQQKKPSDLAQLLCIIRHFQEADLEVVYNGNRFPAYDAAKTTRSYLVKNFERNDTAEKWIHTHAYRSMGSGDPVYFEFPDGARYLARDVLMEALQELKRLSQ